MDGRTNWTTRFGITTRQETSFDPANANRTVLTIPSVGVPATNVYLHGRLISTSCGILGGSTNAYDGHGRLVRVTDVRTGTTTNTFDAADRVTAVATPAPASGQGSQVTTNYYDSVGRVIRTVLPDSDSVTIDYFRNRPAEPCGAGGAPGSFTGRANRRDRAWVGFSRWDRAAGSWARRFPSSPWASAARCLC